jgi:hypothetical protein
VGRTFHGGNNGSFVFPQFILQSGLRETKELGHFFLSFLIGFGKSLKLSLTFVESDPG